MFPESLPGLAGCALSILSYTVTLMFARKSNKTWIGVSRMIILVRSEHHWNNREWMINLAGADRNETHTSETVTTSWYAQQLCSPFKALWSSYYVHKGFIKSLWQHCDLHKSTYWWGMFPQRIPVLFFLFSMVWWSHSSISAVTRLPWRC